MLAVIVDLVAGEEQQVGILGLDVADDVRARAAVVVAVAGVTQTPLSSSVIVVFWALLGVYIQTSVDARNAAPSRRTLREPARLSAT